MGTMRVVMFGFAIAVAFGTAPHVVASHASAAARPDLVRKLDTQVDTVAGARKVSFDALGRRFLLELAPVSLFAPGARTLWVSDSGVRIEMPSETYLAGRLRDDSDARVRISARGSELDGIVVTKDDTYFLEPARGGLAVTRQSDLPPAPGRCGTQHAAIGSGLDTATDTARATGGVAGAAPARAEISLVADYEFYRLHGNRAAAVMQDQINLVNAIYERELGVTFLIRSTVVHTSAGDPFSATADPNTLLDEFSDYAGAGNSPIAGSDLAHLFTGRHLNGGVIGIAWLGTVCDGRFATGLSQDLPANVFATVVAHEIGHNFGASHDAARCTNPATGFIMQPNLGCVGRSGFSPQSRNDIAPVVESSSCLSAAGPPAPTPTPTRSRPPAGTPTMTRPVVPPGTPTITRTRAPTRTATPTGPTRTPTETPLFSPTRVPGLALWLDAGRLAGLADGGPIAAWMDASGSGRDATQAIGDQRPTYRRSALNGLPAVRFDGVDDRLGVSIALPQGPDVTIIIVGRPDTLGRRAILDLGNSGAGTGFIITPERAVRTANGERRWQPSASMSAPAITVVRQNGATTTLLATWVNGERLAVAQTRAGRIATAGAATIGAPSGGAGATFAGDIAEILIYAQALSTAERTALQSYLAAKYGIL